MVRVGEKPLFEKLCNGLWELSTATLRRTHGRGERGWSEQWCSNGRGLVGRSLARGHHGRTIGLLGLLGDTLRGRRAVDGRIRVVGRVAAARRVAVDGRCRRRGRIGYRRESVVLGGLYMQLGTGAGVVNRRKLLLGRDLGVLERDGVYRMILLLLVPLRRTRRGRAVRVLWRGLALDIVDGRKNERAHLVLGRDSLVLVVVGRRRVRALVCRRICRRDLGVCTHPTMIRGRIGRRERLRGKV